MPDTVDASLQTAVTGIREAFADDLISVALFGSAAENRRRQVSDTNMLVVVKRLETSRVNAARGIMALAHVALRLRLLILCEHEIGAMASAFPVKLQDIRRRRKILFGKDVMADVVIPRLESIAQLRQALLNLALRLREQWLVARDDQQRGQVAATTAGGLRVCAAELLILEGGSTLSPREALEKVAGSALPELSAAREGSLQSGTGTGLLERMLALVETMRARAEKLA